MGRRMMRALGAGLMEAGNQAQLSRKEQLELKRQQNLKDIADGRQGLMREQMNLTREGQAEQASFNAQRLAEMDADRAADKEYRHTESIKTADFRADQAARAEAARVRDEERIEAARVRAHEESIAVAAYREQSLENEKEYRAGLREDRVLEGLSEDYAALELESPENMVRKEYYGRYAEAMKTLTEQGADQSEISAELGALKANFEDEQTRELSPAERKAKMGDIRRHIDKVETFYRTGNARMNRIKRWKDDNMQLEDVLQQSGATARDRSAVEAYDAEQANPPPDPKPDVVEESGGLMDSVGDFFGDMFSGAKPTVHTPSPRGSQAPIETGLMGAMPGIKSGVSDYWNKGNVKQ